MCVWGRHVPRHVCGGHVGEASSLSTMWLLGTKLRLSGLAPSEPPLQHPIKNVKIRGWGDGLALATLPHDPGLVSSTHVAAPNCL